MLSVVALAAALVLVPDLEKRAVAEARHAWVVAGRSLDRWTGSLAVGTPPETGGAARPNVPLIQSNPGGPMGLRFDTAGGRRVYRVADAAVWDRLAAEGVAGDQTVPADQALRFVASAAEPGYLTIFAIEDGSPVQLFPNRSRPDGRFSRREAS